MAAARRRAEKRSTDVCAPQVSPELAALLAKVQEQIALDAFAARRAIGAVPVLSTPPEGCKARFATIGGDQALQVHSPDYFDCDAQGAAQYELVLYRDHVITHPDWQHPAVWRGSECRRDQFGVSWRRDLRLVTDDFGTLVPSGGLQ